MHLSTKALYLLLLYCLSASVIRAQSGSQSQPAPPPQPGSQSQLPSQTKSGPQPTSAAKDSLAQLSGLTNAIKTYHTYLTPEPELYRGGQYAEYTFLIAKGHPFFDIDSMIIGTVSYNGILYENVPLKYDIVKDALLTDDPYDYYKIFLISEQISRFTIGNHVFIHLTDSLNRTAPRVGFYEQLYKGSHITLLKKEKKTVWDDLSSPGEGNKRFITLEESYYITKGDTYYPVNNKASLLYALKDKSKDVKRFLRTNVLNVRRDKGNALLKVVAWYDGIIQ